MHTPEHEGKASSETRQRQLTQWWRTVLDAEPKVVGHVLGLGAGSRSTSGWKIRPQVPQAGMMDDGWWILAAEAARSFPPISPCSPHSSPSSPSPPTSFTTSLPFGGLISTPSPSGHAFCFASSNPLFAPTLDLSTTDLAQRHYGRTLDGEGNWIS